MLGTKSDLFNAASGKMPKRVFTNTDSGGAGTGTTTPQQGTYAEALSRKGLLSQAFPSLAAQNATSIANTNQPYQPYVSAVGAPATKTFADVLARTGRTSSGSGKYGGFSNAGDLTTAIGGAAMNVRDVTVPQLRSTARDYYTKLDKGYRQALGPLTGFTSEYNPGVVSAGNFRIADQLSMPQYANQRAAIKSFTPTLGSWYTEQAKPAEEYLQTAQQLEMTPLSQLAASIATRGYGMDANLAAGKFAGLDSEYFKRNRDTQYMNQYGVPYDEYTALQKEQEDALNTARDQDEADALSNIESITGFSYGALSPIAGQTKIQMYNTLANTYKYKDLNNDSAETSSNGAGIVAQYREYISSAQPDKAEELIASIDATPGAEALGLLLRALQNRLVTIPSKASENAIIWGTPIDQ
jgi:hypothetical protein